MKLLLILAARAYKLKLRYEESGYPTKVDFGDQDFNIAYGHEDKKWVNPLSIADDGTDDD